MRYQVKAQAINPKVAARMQARKEASRDLETFCASIPEASKDRTEEQTAKYKQLKQLVHNRNRLISGEPGYEESAIVKAAASVTWRAEHPDYSATWKTEHPDYDKIHNKMKTEKMGAAAAERAATANNLLCTRQPMDERDEILHAIASVMRCLFQLNAMCPRDKGLVVQVCYASPETLDTAQTEAYRALCAGRPALLPKGRVGCFHRTELVQKYNFGFQAYECTAGPRSRAAEDECHNWLFQHVASLAYMQELQSLMHIQCAHHSNPHPPV